MMKSKAASDVEANVKFYLYGCEHFTSISQKKERPYAVAWPDVCSRAHGRDGVTRVYGARGMLTRFNLAPLY
jgi:hypothetical protein